MLQQTLRFTRPYAQSCKNEPWAVRLTWGTKVKGRCNAAAECVKAWRTFMLTFRLHGITSPAEQTYMHTYVHTSIHAYIHAGHTYIHTCIQKAYIERETERERERERDGLMHTHVCMNTNMSVCVYVWINNTSVYTYVEIQLICPDEYMIIHGIHW